MTIKTDSNSNNNNSRTDSISLPPFVNYPHLLFSNPISTFFSQFLFSPPIITVQFRSYLSQEKFFSTLRSIHFVWRLHTEHSLNKPLCDSSGFNAAFFNCSSAAVIVKISKLFLTCQSSFIKDKSVAWEVSLLKIEEGLRGMSFI